MKRIADVVLAAVGLLLVLPLLTLAAIGVSLAIGPPLLFRQIRPGLHGKPFTMLKLRTMREAVDENGNALPDARRLTRLGKVLRATSIDELPQLWNVARGDMSLVGPRPLLMEYLPRYTREQARRHDVRPGITGWAQVNGRNTLDWEDRLKLDVWYVDNRSILLDPRILMLTVRKVILRQGIDQAPGTTMTKFNGAHRGDGGALGSGASL